MSRSRRSLAYGRWFKLDDVAVRGIRDVTLTDIEFASQLGYRIKLLAAIRRSLFPATANSAVSTTLMFISSIYFSGQTGTAALNSTFLLSIKPPEKPETLRGRVFFRSQATDFRIQIPARIMIMNYITPGSRGQMNSPPPQRPRL